MMKCCKKDKFFLDIEYWKSFHSVDKRSAGHEKGHIFLQMRWVAREIATTFY